MQMSAFGDGQEQLLLKKHREAVDRLWVSKLEQHVCQGSQAQFSTLLLQFCLEKRAEAIA